MSDVFLSYAFTERSRAMAVRATLVADGWTVWMDNGSEDGGSAGLVEALGVPPGQDYDELINRAIEAAGFVVVLDSEVYRSRPHCLSELEHAEECGKPVVLVDGTEPDLDRMRAHRTLADAHARLLPTLKGDTVAAPGSTARWLVGDPRAADARLLRAADLSTTGMRLPPGANQVLASLLRSERQRGWARWMSAVAILVVLGSLAGVATLAGISAAADRGRASETRNAASSLELANRALHADDTRAALGLARDAVTEQRNEVSTSAQRQVEFAAAADRVVRVPAATYYGIAASRDLSTVAMVRQGAVVVVDVPSSRSTIINSDVWPSTRVVVGPDAVWVIDVNDALRLVDPQAGTIDVVDPGPFEDLAIDGNGQLWLLAADGTLSQRSAGVDGPGLVVATSVWGDDIAVDAEFGRLYLRTGSTVSSYTYRPDAAGVPVLGESIWDTGFEEAVPELDSLASGTVDSDGGDLVVCGHGVAVSQSWRWVGRSGNRLLAIGSDGSTPEQWTWSNSSFGAGCGVGDAAWVSDALGFEPTSFDPGGWTPRALAGPRVVSAVGATADGTSVRVEATGALHIYTPKAMAWSRKDGTLVAAQPLAGGMVRVDRDGSVVWDPDGAGQVTELGKLDGIPYSASAASADAWWVSVAGELARITPGNAEPIRVHRDLGKVVDPKLSPDGSTVCTHTDESVACVAAESGDVVLELAAPVDPDERVTSAEWNAGRVLMTTNYGRIILMGGEGDVVREVAVTAGSSVTTFASEKGDVVAATGDGFLRRYDRDLREVRAAFVETGGATLLRVGDDHLLLGSVTEYDTRLVDIATLQVQAVLLSGVRDLERVVPDPSGTRLLALTPFQENGDGSDDDEPAVLTVVPMPGQDVVLPD